MQFCRISFSESYIRYTPDFIPAGGSKSFIVIRESRLAYNILRCLVDRDIGTTDIFAGHADHEYCHASEENDRAHES